MVEKKTIELVDKDTLSADIGDKSQLQTEDKSNLVAAINEVKNNSSSFAKDVTLEDKSNKFEATNVEDALLENKTSILSLEEDAGDLATLQTTNKDNLVNAINEVFQNANNGKNIIANAIGSPLVNSDTFSVMGTKIDVLTQTFQNTLNEKGVEVLPSDKMSTLIDKVIESPSVSINNLVRIYALQGSGNGVIFDEDFNILSTTTTGMSSTAGVGALGENGSVRVFTTQDSSGGANSITEYAENFTTVKNKIVFPGRMMSCAVCKVNDQIRLYTSIRNSFNLEIVDGETLAKIETVTPSFQGTGMDFCFDGTKTRCFSSGFPEYKGIREFDLDTLTVINSKDLSSLEGGDVQGVGAYFDGQKVNIALSKAGTNKIYKINANTLEVEGSILQSVSFAGIGGANKIVTELEYKGQKYYKLGEV